MTEHHRQHGDTERMSRGFDARIESGFEWLEANARSVMLVGGGLLLLGGLIAGIFEYSSRQEEAAQTALERVERAYFAGMGTPIAEIYLTEPANRDQAQRAREAALVGYQQVTLDYPGRVAASAAQLRAAEVEIELGRLAAASERLGALAAALDVDPLRASALRLQGYAFEEQEKFAEAAAAYEAGAVITDYPGREALWLAASDNYLRTGEIERAIDALREVLAIAPAWAERQGLLERLAGLEAMLPPTEAS